MNLRSKLESLSSAKLIEELSTWIYKPPLSIETPHLLEVAAPLRIPILILKFDTEVSMNGMLGFLENSAGLYFPETIAAFDTIGASETASILRAIKKTLDLHGVSPSKLRADFAGTGEFQVTSFAELHGDLGTLPTEIEQDARRLYVYAELGAAEQVWSLLETFVDQHRPELIAEIGRLAAE